MGSNTVSFPSDSAAEMLPVSSTKAATQDTAASLTEQTQNTSQQVTDCLLRGGGIALGCLGAIGATRGSVKAFKYAQERLQDRHSFLGRECMLTPSCNFHLLNEKEGKLFLEICSIDKPELDDIFKNSYAERVFFRAVSSCRPDQPFPSLNFDPASNNLIEDRVAVLAGEEKESPTLLLQEINKLFRDSYSALYREGVVARSMGLPTKEDIHVLIPLCEVSPDGGRDLIFASISEKDFLRFGNPAELSRISGASDKLVGRIAHLHAAYKEDAAFRIASGEALFPRITIFVKT